MTQVSHRKLFEIFQIGEKDPLYIPDVARAMQNVLLTGEYQHWNDWPAWNNLQKFIEKVSKIDGLKDLANDVKFDEDTRLGEIEMEKLWCFLFKISFLFDINIASRKCIQSICCRYKLNVKISDSLSFFDLCQGSFNHMYSSFESDCFFDQDDNLVVTFYDKHDERSFPDYGRKPSFFQELDSLGVKLKQISATEWQSEDASVLVVCAKKTDKMKYYGNTTISTLMQRASVREL